MKSEIKALWVDALRSGEYTQGRGQLRDTNNKYCCLGVLCELAVKAEATPESKSIDCELGDACFVQHGYSYHGCTSYLPQAVIDWAGVDSNDPMIDGKGLGQWNDYGASFTKIAELIEDNL